MHPTILAAAQRLQSTFHPARILLVGSWARGEQTADSDIDLVVLFDHSVDWQLAGAMRGALRGLPASFDIMATSLSEWQQREQLRASFEHVLAREAVEFGGHV